MYIFVGVCLQKFKSIFFIQIFHFLFHSYIHVSSKLIDRFGALAVNFILSVKLNNRTLREIPGRPQMLARTQTYLIIIKVTYPEKKDRNCSEKCQHEF